MGSGTISLDITGAFTNDADQIATIVVYETRPGGGEFSNPKVTVQYVANKVSFAHLNAIKLADDSPSGQVTGITLTNKTMPRLLQLSKQSGGSCILVGPSVVPSPVLYDYGVDCMAGSIIDDPERAIAATMHGSTSGIFGNGVTKMRVERPGWLS